MEKLEKNINDQSLSIKKSREHISTIHSAIQDNISELNLIKVLRNDSNSEIESIREEIEQIQGSFYNLKIQTYDLYESFKENKIEAQQFQLKTVERLTRILNSLEDC
ncbi:unnamed protein product [Brachionus calyciflorus]|uniref:Uncharacterized protein n=1 Tax=Brachionus calyciflorus TaxID=104777 RepID=A0A814N8Z4_9BILA|nr:unnamed protein product [Brachionus calyciflorus]